MNGKQRAGRSRAPHERGRHDARKVVLALKSLLELGEELRTRRIELGVSLEEVQERTKIRVRYLEAIESGDWSVLPGNVYARGFVRRYAEYIGLDGNALLHQYADQAALVQADQERVQGDQGDAPKQRPVVTGPVSSTPAWPTPNAQHQADADTGAPAPSSLPTPERTERTERSDAGQSSPRRTRPAAARPAGKSRRRVRTSGIGSQAAVVVGLLVVLGGAWFFLYGPGHGGSPANSGAGNPTGSGAGNVANHANTSRSNGANGSGSANAPGNAARSNATGNTIGNSANSTGPASTTLVSAQPFQSSPPTQPYLVSTTQPLTVTLSVSSSACWVSVTADGSVVDGSDTLQPGQTKTWTGNQSVSIYLGHPASASITVNGRPVSLPGQQNPYHVQFTKSGK